MRSRSLELLFTRSMKTLKLSFNSSRVNALVILLLFVNRIWSQDYVVIEELEGYESDDFFATSVSISGDTLVVGARGEDSLDPNNEGDNTGNFVGAAYVYVRNETTNAWTRQAYLKASNAGNLDQFGKSVSISGDIIVVGADGEASNSVLINQGEGDDSAPFAGAAYVFVRDGSTNIWTQEAYLKASNTGQSDNFGRSVSISGATVVVGAVGEDSSSGLNPADDTAGSAGAAYVFVRDGSGVWTQQAYLKASNAGTGDNFGTAVSISGDTVVVGAQAEASNSTTINEGEDNNSAGGAGAAYVFVRDGSGVWTQQAYLKASNTNPGDNFGYSVSIYENTIVVGAPSESSNSATINEGEDDNNAPWSGAAYVFVRDDSEWTQQAYLKASNSDDNDEFGKSVSIEGDKIVVGAIKEQDGEGAIYVFERNGTKWTQEGYLKEQNPGASNNLGNSVVLAGGYVVGTATGVSKAILFGPTIVATTGAITTGTPTTGGVMSTPTTGGDGIETEIVLFSQYSSSKQISITEGECLNFKNAAGRQQSISCYHEGDDGAELSSDDQPISSSDSVIFSQTISDDTSLTHCFAPAGVYTCYIHPGKSRNVARGKHPIDSIGFGSKSLPSKGKSKHGKHRSSSSDSSDDSSESSSSSSGTAEGYWIVIYVSATQKVIDKLFVEEGGSDSVNISTLHQNTFGISRYFFTIMAVVALLTIGVAILLMKRRTKSSPLLVIKHHDYHTIVMSQDN